MNASPLSMRRIFLICIALVATGVVLFLHWQRSRLSERQHLASHPRIHFDTLTLERTPCFGSCPSYTVTVERNGHVTYRAIDSGQPPEGKTGGVEVIKKGQIPENSLHALISAVESPEYAELEASYIWRATDLPGVMITVSGNGTSRNTYVSGIPCRKDAKADPIYQKWKAGTPPVPDIFCTVENLVDTASCALYWGQSTRPFMTSDDPTLPVPARCKATL